MGPTSSVLLLCRDQAAKWFVFMSQGSGGMVLVDPLFQRTLVAECRARNIPVIFDEVRTTTAPAPSYLANISFTRTDPHAQSEGDRSFRTAPLRDCDSAARPRAPLLSQH